MKIIVCMKQVPATQKVDIDPETDNLKRSGQSARTNPYDLYALECALKIREQTGGTVTVLTMGPPQAESMIRDAYSMEADEGVILSDRKLKFDADKCSLCGICIEKCPFGAISMGEQGIELNENCRMCRICVRECPNQALYFEQKAKKEDKSKWNGILVYAEQERGEIHPVVYELIGEARKLAAPVGYQVYAVMVGPEGTAANAGKLLQYGVREVFVYEHQGFAGFKADCYTDAVADCISSLRPSVVLVGGTSLGRSLAPRLSTRFHMGLTADCTTQAVSRSW